MKKIFISGASQGIGLAIARRFHREGWQVGICARGSENLKMAEKELPGLLTFSCDLSVKEEVKDLSAKVLAKMGRLDILVNNGGIFIPGEMHLEEDEQYEKVMATNLNSAFYLTKAMLPDMKAEKKGHIVNICSIASLQAYPSGGTYGISKFGLLGFSKALREELKPFNIAVTSVMPGATWTASWENSGQEPERMIPVEDIAEIIWTSCNLSARSVVEEIVIRPMQGDL